MALHENDTLARASESPAEVDQRAIQLVVAAFQAGQDREAQFRWLFDRFSPSLRRFFGRKGMSADLCFDLTQETFVGVYRGLETYRPEARFETWLYTIANSVYLKLIRARSASKRSGVEVSTGEEGDAFEDAAGKARDEPLAQVLDAEQKEVLRRAVENLPEQMRRCLKLRVYHEMSYREVATVLGLSIETVKAHLFQARGKLKKALGA